MNGEAHRLRKRRSARVAAIAGGALAVFAAGAGSGLAAADYFTDRPRPVAAGPGATSPRAAAPVPAVQQGPVTPRTETPSEARRLSSAFAATAKAVRPSVVRIDIEREAPRLAQAQRRPFLEGIPRGFERFFEFDFGEGAPDQPRTPGPAPVAGTGSGVILDGAGHIVTNSHVVERAAKVKVTLHDGRELSARLVGRDPRTDVAVVKLESVPKDLVSARLGDSDRVEVGEWVLAIGSPLGLEQTVTAGIVSSAGRVDGRRVAMSGDRVRRYIQTDAKINPGNSGGALVNLDGELVGINTLIRVGAGGAYGFAVPVNEVRRVATTLMAEGRVRYPYLGVAVRDLDTLDPDTRARLGSGAPTKGAFVGEVTPGSPAAKAGIAQGDVIVKLDDRAVALASDVVDHVSAGKIGGTVAVTVHRAGKTRTVTAQLTEAPSQLAENAQSDGLGLALQTLTPQLAESLGLPRDATGVAIADVRAGSPAERAGLRAGDVLLDVDRKPVATAEDAVSRLREKGPHLVRVRGPAGTRLVPLRVE